MIRTHLAYLGSDSLFLPATLHLIRIPCSLSSWTAVVASVPTLHPFPSSTSRISSSLSSRYEQSVRKQTDGSFCLLVQIDSDMVKYIFVTIHYLCFECFGAFESGHAYLQCLPMTLFEFLYSNFVCWFNCSNDLHIPLFFTFVLILF